MGEAGEAKAQCALSTLRNLLRDEEASVDLLVKNQTSGGVVGQYHFLEWRKVMRAAELVRDGEETVTFHPDQLGGPAELWDARLMVTNVRNDGAVHTCGGGGERVGWGGETVLPIV